MGSYNTIDYCISIYIYKEYCIAQNVGGEKPWWIWRIGPKFYPSKFMYVATGIS